ncbi:PAS domain S-box protein [Oscillatoria sp. FACHB-1407]|uniref:PAS domain S-box protein n=1 Tax=Oscillatoria sp. FACHB-1407 TaxID=2692847 RepID=UPI001681F386|nr:PAS domain S-box protein [Oscillatoria sp. FACHB-1407]MBD2463455.1 PAS domain S-box protein [Oscillatoria sp. FACHB-1407]
MSMGRQLLTYSVAIGLTVIATLLSFWLEDILSRTTGVFFYIAIVISTWYGGRRPGIVTTVLSVLALNYYFITPTHQIYILRFEDFFWLLLVAVVGLVINFLTASLQESNRIAVERMQLLQQEQAAHNEMEVLLQQLEAERHQLEQILQQMPVGVAIAEAPSGKLLFHNEEAIRLLRQPLLNSDTSQGYIQYGAIHADGQSYQPDEYPIARSLLSGEVVKAEEMHYRRGDGTTTLFSVSAAPILNRDGQIVSTVSTFEDITDRKQAEIALREKEQQLQQLSDSMPQFVWISNAQGETEYVNRRWLEYSGLTVEQSRDTQKVAEFLHPEEAQSMSEQWMNAQATQQPFEIEARLKRASDGVYRWFLMRSVPVLDEQGQVLRWYGTSTDISDRKQTEQTLAKELLRIQTLFNTSFDGIVILDGQGRVVNANPRFAEMIGHTPEEIANLSVSDWDAQFNDEELQQVMQDCLSRKMGVFETQHRRKNGSTYDVEISYNVVEWEGEILRFCACRDISDRKRIEAERKRAEEALQEREAILRLFIQNAPAGIAMFDREMRFLIGSQRWADDYYQGSLESTIGRSHYELFPELPERWRQIHQRCLAGAIEKCDEDLFVRTDGWQQWTRWETRPWYTATDEIGGIIIFAEDITQRKQSETAILQLNQELQQKVTELQTLLDVIPIGIGIAEDPECQHIRVNPAFADALGIPPRANASLSASEEERPTTFRVYQNGREMPPEELPLQYAAAHGVEIRDLEVDVVWQDGTTVTLLEYAAPLLNASGQLRGSVGAFLNITDRKRAEQALRDREQQLTLALQAAKAGAWTWELPTNRLYWSDEYYRVFGLEPGSVEPSSENGFSRLHPDDREWVERETTEAIAQGKNTNIEYRILLPDGTSRWVIGIGQMFYDELNQPARMAGIVVDITERKQAEAALRESQERYRTLVQNFPNGAVFLFDNDLRYVLAEGQGLTQAGLDRVSLEGKTIWEVLDTQTCELLEPLYRGALSGNSETLEIPFGDRIYFVHCLPVFDDQGFVRLGMLMSQDITLQKQAEQVLRTARDELERQVQERTRELQEANILLAQREREFRTLVENTPDVITRHDRQYRYLYVNPAGTQAAGITLQFYLGKQPSELDYPEAITQFWEASLEEVFVTGEMRIDEFEVINLDEPRSYQVYVVPEREADNSITSVITIARDITQLRQAERSTRKLAEELQRSNQELEQFAYIASHDLQEPLRAITSFTQLLAQEYKAQLDGDADMYIEFIVDGATRMQQLIRDLLTYSRVGRYELQLQPTDCNVLLERVKKDLQVAIAENQAIITADPLPTITADPNQMKNLLQNLISNSLKYRSKTDPRIHISAKSHTVEKTNDLSHPGSSRLTMGSEEWLFSLQDNGIGIEPQYAERIFGIFQRLHTSDEYSGTGLGLAICQKIIERHQGRIWVESQLGQGATFFFTIPLSIKTHDDNPRPITQNPAC